MVCGSAHVFSRQSNNSVNMKGSKGSAKTLCSEMTCCFSRKGQAITNKILYMKGFTKMRPWPAHFLFLQFHFF